MQILTFQRGNFGKKLILLTKLFLLSKSLSKLKNEFVAIIFDLRYKTFIIFIISLNNPNYNYKIIIQSFYKG